MNGQRKKLPFFIGMGMIAAGIIAMIVSNNVGEAVRPYIVFGGVIIFIAGFAGTIIYTTLKDSPGGFDSPKKEKKPLTRAKILLIISGVICMAGFLALLAGFILFSETNYLLVLVGMIAFLGGGSAAISVFTKNMTEFVAKEDIAEFEVNGEGVPGADKDSENKE